MERLFGAFFGHFDPLCALLGRWVGAKAQSESGRPEVGVKLGGESKLVGPKGQVASRPLLGAFLTHFGRFGFVCFLSFLAIWTQCWVQTPKVGVKWGGMSKLVSLDGPFDAIFGTISEPFGPTCLKPRPFRP